MYVLFPRIEAGMPTVCSETCTGRMRYLGVMLYDADRVQEAASATNEEDLYEKQLDLFLDPFDEEVIAEAEKKVSVMNGLLQLKILQCIN